jgi:hypothetical protein
MALIAIPVSREILEDTCNVDQKRLFGTTDISKCQVPTLARLDRVAFLAHLASGRFSSLRAARRYALRATWIRHRSIRPRKSFPRV